MMGLNVVNDDNEEEVEEGQSQEDKEVQRILQRRKETKRKIVWGMLNMSKNALYTIFLYTVQ